MALPTSSRSSATRVFSAEYTRQTTNVTICAPTTIGSAFNAYGRNPWNCGFANRIRYANGYEATAITRSSNSSANRLARAEDRGRLSGRIMSLMRNAAEAAAYHKGHQPHARPPRYSGLHPGHRRHRTPGAARVRRARAALE